MCVYVHPLPDPNSCRSMPSPSCLMLSQQQTGPHNAQIILSENVNTAYLNDENGRNIWITPI